MLTSLLSYLYINIWYNMRIHLFYKINRRIANADCIFVAILQQNA